jgi:hypothetical protein
MARPGAIETYRSYGSTDDFDTDREEMERAGWRVENVSTSESGGLLRRLFRRPATLVEAHYLREEWPAEDV